MSSIVVGMSGGIDSALAASFLKEDGHDVIGVTLKMLDGESAEKSAEKARQQAMHIGIKHYVADCRNEFKERIIDNFTNAYKIGQTPSPCARCNTEIKWKLLHDFADKMDVDYIASGHYVGTTRHNGHHYITKGLDQRKDQSYYLWNLSEKYIQRLMQPLSKHEKGRSKAEAIKRNIADKILDRESMGICFLNGNDYRNFLIDTVPEIIQECRPGDVVDENGNVVGRHKGIPFYTIGQKRDIELHEPREAFVKRIDLKQNIIEIGKKSDLLTDTFKITDTHFIDRQEIKPDTLLEVKVRGYGLNPTGHASIDIATGIVKLQEPAWAIAPGQPVVFYIGNRVVGGGIATI